VGFVLNTKENIKAEFSRGLNLHQHGEFEKAETIYRNILAVDKNHFESLHLLGLIEFTKGHFEISIELIEKAVALYPKYDAAYYNLGRAYEEANQKDKAQKNYEIAVRLDPQNAAAFGSLGNVLDEKGKHKEALKAHENALRLAPNSAQGLTNKGVTLRALKRLEEALECHNKAISIVPDFVDAFINRGGVLMDMKGYEYAARCFAHVIKLKPDFAPAYLKLSEAEREMNQSEKAIISAEKAFRLDPKLKNCFTNRYTLGAELCAWSDYDKDVQHIRQMIQDGSIDISPFTIHGTWNDRSVQLAAGLNNGALYEKNWAQNPPHIFSKVARPKIRLAYISGDFKNHPVSQLVTGLLENHDREKFEIIAFSLGVNTNDDFHKRVLRAVDEYYHVEKLDINDIVKLVREKNIDIAIDLSGYTAFSKPAIYAQRVAPVQVSYLGYSGTTGANFIDYIIGDETIIPVSHHDGYTEKVAYMPYTYMPSDNSRVMAEHKFERHELGLPETGVVYCAFNNPNKLNPANFSSWMKILQAVSGSVLWLNVKNPLAKTNLKKEAEARGVDPNRLVFSTFLSDPEHFRRYQSADIFLDSLPYNAHTTCNEALWAGLPVLTRLGEAFAGRVAASLLKTVGLDELITHSVAEYEAKAIALGNNPKEITRLKSLLGENRIKSPLFDAPQYARFLENLYEQMHSRFLNGLPPDHISTKI
jgi:protein O-GlcNAc transferase